MDNTNLNGTVSTRNCDHPLKCTNITKNLNIVSVFSKDAVVSSTTNEVKRSARLSRKRTFQDRLAVENEDLSGDAEKRNSMAKNMQNNKTELRKIVVPRNTVKKTNSRPHIFTKSTKNSIQNDCDPSKVSKVEHSLSADIDNESNISIKSSSKTHKNKTYSKSIASTKSKSMLHIENKDEISNEFEENDNFVFIRKRGRPSFKKIDFQKTDIVSTRNDNDELDKQKTKGLTVIVEKLHNVHEPELSLKSFDDNTMMIENNGYKPSKVKRKRSDGDKLTDTVETESCIPEATSSSGASIIEPIIPGQMPTSALSDTNDQPLHLGILEPDISLLSNRFNIQFEMFRKSIVGESLSVFNENYSESVTPSMITVSPIVADDFEVNPRENESRNIYKYKIEPVRESLAYEKQNLKDLMDELIKTMPSWSLNIVHNPPRYVISHVSIDMFGIPNLNKAIVLDRYFRGSIYINKSLNYKYCKYYRTANEIVKLIKELNDISM